MKSILNIFLEAKEMKPVIGDGFNIASMPGVKNHKIGVSGDGLPLFFIKCEDSASVKSLDYNLEYISVQFNLHCQLLSKERVISNGTYTILSLKTDSVSMQEYFMDIIYLVIKKLPSNPSLKQLKIEVEKLISLFSKFSKPPQKTIQGLWAELLIIEQANNPDYLIKAWHVSPSDKFDFNDGIDKIEVKSTSRSKRIHNFSIEQLNPNKNSGLIIASVFAIEAGVGKNIFDIALLIHKKIKNKDLSLQVNQIIADTIGKDLESAFDIFYDYQLAIDSKAFYESSSIPKIDINNIPMQVSNIRFDCDLSDITPLKRVKSKSLLHNSLF